jgi:hypothetical protein
VQLKSAVQLKSVVRPSHGKDYFAMGQNNHTQQKKAHGKRATEARQSHIRAHDKEESHGKEGIQCTAKKSAMACRETMPCTALSSTAKEPLSCAHPFAMRKIVFFNFFISILFFLILMFISQLVLYFVDYLLVVLKTLCIYPCFLQYNILYIVIPTPIYIRVCRAYLARRTTKSALLDMALPCGLCCAYSGLCRANIAHGNARLSDSVSCAFGCLRYEVASQCRIFGVGCMRRSCMFYSVEINCLVLSISLNFWFNWLVHAIQYGIRAVRSA